jgi:hypothetical protein
VYTGVGGIWILLDKLISSPLELLQKERSRLEKFQALYFSTLETLIEDYEKRKFALLSIIQAISFKIENSHHREGEARTESLLLRVLLAPGPFKQSTITVQINFLNTPKHWAR